MRSGTTIGYAKHRIRIGYAFTVSFRATSKFTSSQQPNYETWLNQIVAAYQIHADGKDRTFSRFLLDLPDVPQDVLNLLRESCVEPERSVLIYLY